MKSKTPLILITLILVAAVLFACGRQIGQGIVNRETAGAETTKTQDIPVAQKKVVEPESSSPEAYEEAPVQTPAPQLAAEPVIDQHQVENIFFNNEPGFLVDSVNYSPHKVWYEDGYLHAEMYITNGLSDVVYNIDNIYLKLSNEFVVIAEADFGPLEDILIAPHQTIIWTFIFGGNAVITHDADLTGWINTRSSSTYSN